MNPSPRTRDDHFRATRAYRLLREFMRDGQRHTLREMAAVTGQSEAATSARWRELKHPCAADNFPGFEPHVLPIGEGGLRIYWVTARGTEQLKMDLAI